MWDRLVARRFRWSVWSRYHQVLKPGSEFLRYRRCDVQHTLSKKHVECFLKFLSTRGYLITAIDDYKLVLKIEKEVCMVAAI